MRRPKVLVTLNRIDKRVDSAVFGRDGFYYWRRPAVGAIRYRKQQLDLSLGPQHAIAVGFVDREYVADLHYSRFHCLHRVTHPRHKHDYGHIGGLDDVDLILPDANCFDDDFIISGSIQYSHGINRRAGDSAQMPTR